MRLSDKDLVENATRSVTGLSDRLYQSAQRIAELEEEVKNLELLVRDGIDLARRR